MSQPPISTATIKALVDVITGGHGMASPADAIGIYRTASKIEGLMMECDLDFKVGSSRVSSLLDYLRGMATDSLDSDRTAKLERVIIRVAEPQDYALDPAKQQAVVEHLNRFLIRDGRQIILHGTRPQLVSRGLSAAVVGTISAKAATINFDTVERDIGRALASAENDPEDAVTAACSIVESVCRSILIELQLELPSKKDIEGLFRAVQEPLNLSPGKANSQALIEADVRQILGGLMTTAKGIGALRTHSGDAHGRERGYARIDARIAKLAIHSASTLSLFLIETWERKFRRALPSAGVEGAA